MVFFLPVILFPIAALAQEDDTHWLNNWQTSEHGTSGIYRLDSAHSLKPHMLNLSLGATWSSFSDLLQAEDTDLYQLYTMNVVFSPFAGFEAALRYGLIFNNFSSFVNRSTQQLGDPALMLKYSYQLLDGLALAGYENLVIPSSTTGSGLQPKALTSTTGVLLTKQLMPTLEGTVSLAYSLNRSYQLAGNPPLAADERLAFDISAGQNRLLYGAGLIAQTQHFSSVRLAGFAEFTGEVISSISLSQNPVYADVGLKAGWPQADPVVEFSAAGQLCVAGKNNGLIATIPESLPWAVLAQLTVHINLNPQEKAPGGCVVDADCGANQFCSNHLCTIVRVITDSANSPGQQAHTITVFGNVFDRNTNKPIPESEVIIAGYGPVAVYYKTGGFQSGPLPLAGPDLVLTARAAGYEPENKSVSRKRIASGAKVVFSLRPSGQPKNAILKGSVTEASTGEPVRKATLFIPSLRKTVHIDHGGSFHVELPAKQRFDVLITAKGYITQQKKISLRLGETVIMNIEMVSRKNKKNKSK